MPETVCPWCSTAIPEHATACPNCQAKLDGTESEGVAIPGLTEVPPALRQYAAKPVAKHNRWNILTTMFTDDSVPSSTDTLGPSDPSALLPPSAEVKAEMARLDAEIAAQALAWEIESAQAGILADPAPAADPAAVGEGDPAADSATATPAESQEG